MFYQWWVLEEICNNEMKMAEGNCYCSASGLVVMAVLNNTPSHIDRLGKPPPVPLNCWSYFSPPNTNSFLSLSSRKKTLKNGWTLKRKNESEISLSDGISELFRFGKQQSSKKIPLYSREKNLPTLNFRRKSAKSRLGQYRGYIDGPPSGIADFFGHESRSKKQEALLKASKCLLTVN